MRLFALLLALALIVHPPPALTVSAAISLTDVMAVLGPMYTKGGGAPVAFNHAASNVLARQIANGAPVDVFISADEAQMDVAAAAGAIDAATRVKLIGNTLVVVRRRGSPSAPMTDALDWLREPGCRRIAIGDPEAVPAGVYAKRLLVKDGLWTELQPKLVPVASVRAAMTAVDNGGADAALVYASDVFSYRGPAIEVLYAWPGNGPGIVYPAAVVKSSRHQAEAARFLAFLCGAGAAAVFEQHRFKPLRCK